MAQDFAATMSPAGEAVTQLIFDPIARANPYPAYERMRAHDAVHLSNLGMWFVTSYEECARLMRDQRLPRHFGNSWELRAELNDSVGRKWYEHQSRWMLWLDPPDHGRIRSLVNKAFTPRYVEKLRGRVQEVVDALIDEILGRRGGGLARTARLPAAHHGHRRHVGDPTGRPQGLPHPNRAHRTDPRTPPAQGGSGPGG